VLITVNYLHWEFRLFSYLAPEEQDDILVDIFVQFGNLLVKLLGQRIY